MTQIPTPSQLRERQAAQRLADTETAVAAIVEALEAHYVGSPLSVSLTPGQYAAHAFIRDRFKATGWLLTFHSDQRDGASVKIRGFLPPALPPAEREADRVREVLRHEGTVEAAATRLGWSRWAVRLAVTRYGIDWPPACPRAAAGPCCDKGRRHEGACQDPDPAEAELLADDFARRLVLGGVLIEARLQIPEAAGREAVDCVVAACEVAGPGDPPVTRWVAGPVSGATADDLYHAGERTLVHDASGRAIHVLAVGASRSEAIHRACQRLSVEGPAAPAVRWDGDEQRVAALVRLKAIRADLRPASHEDAARARELADPATGEHVDQHGHLVRLEPPDAAEKGGAP